MSLTPSDVEKIAALAKLEINSSETKSYVNSLSSILQLVEQMNRVDTRDIEPMAHPRDCSLRLREDVVTESDQRERFQDIAPATEQGLYLVPRVVE